MAAEEGDRFYLLAQDLNHHLKIDVYKGYFNFHSSNWYGCYIGPESSVSAKPPGSPCTYLDREKPYLSSGELDQNSDAVCFPRLGLIWDLRDQLHLHPLDLFLPIGLLLLQAERLFFLALFLILLLLLLAFLFLKLVFLLIELDNFKFYCICIRRA